MATTDAPNTTTLPEAAIQPTMKEQDKSRKVITQIETLLTNPDKAMPAEAVIKPTVQQLQTGETMATSGLSGQVVAATPTAGTTPTITAATSPTATTTAGPTTATPASMTAATVAGATPTMTAQTGSVTAPMTAQTGTITSDATVRGQLENISQDIQTSLTQGTPLPAFLRGAAEATRAAMQARGLGGSSMMAEALADGLLTASIPVAQADAETYKQMIFQNLNNRQQAAITNANNYFQMDMANLSNKQQASLQNLNVRQSFLLSDQAASNAARQFNATSQNQVDQFYSNLSAQINEQNASRSDAMTQFSTAESNKISALNAQNQVSVEKANADRASVLNKFNAQLLDQRQRFNVENQRVIDQSNVEWRRTINTANTTLVNAANQTNAQNLLNLSNYALSSLWQQWRDEAAWVNSSAENAENRAHNTAIAALERSTELDLADSNKTSALYQLLGKFGIALVS